MNNNQNLNNKVNLAKCSKGNQSHMVCFSQHCKSKAFICKDQNCQCQQDHTVCLKLEVENLQTAILVNSYSLKPLEDKIEKVFDAAIQKLSTERDRVLKEIQDKFHYLGLSKTERKFIDVIKKGQNDAQINCQFVWNLHLGLKGPSEMKENLDGMEKEIKKIGQDFQKELTIFSNKFKNFLQQVKSREEQIFLKSKIVKSIEDQNKLIAFFGDKKVQGAKLLYRASENEFLVSKFHEKCDHISCTLVICETEFGKVIGGFTTYVWFKPKTGGCHYVSAINNTSEHFVFSLTNNDKFTITQNPSNCINLRNDDVFGPAFGGGHDLVIYNKANQNSSSYAQIGHTYTHANYAYNNSATWTKFSGSSSNATFKVKEWQVWQVQFKQ